MNYFKKYQMHYLNGGNLYVLIRLLVENRFRINVKKIPKVFFLLISNILNFPLMLIQKLLFWRRIRNTKIEKDPIFIIGHWRSGTTFLANLITRDRQFGFFNILQTYHPSTYLLLRPILHFFGKKVIPKKRPMDNIKVKIDLPQEEDYAVANRSPYSMIHFIAFPASFEKYYYKYGLFKNIKERQLKSWQRIYRDELKKATFSSGGKQLLVKTPINTGRIKKLMEMFPNAKFIHIYRNPYNVCLSTQRLYGNFFPMYDLQYLVGEAELERNQLNVYEALYKKFFSEKNLIPEGNIVEVKYEEFVEQPFETVKKVYESLGISGFEKQEDVFRKYIEREKEYTPNKYAFPEEKMENIRRKLGFAFKELGYSTEKQD